MSEALLPRYAASTVGDVLTGVAARLGLPGHADPLRLPDAARYVLLLVDGLGLELLEDAADLAPHLAALLPGASELTSTVPSTTATAITSIGTGLPPGQHGMAGYTFRHPFGPGLLNALVGEPGLSGFDVQPRLTLHERLAKDGVQVATVLPAKFAGSGLTAAALRGGRFVGVTDEADVERRVDQVVTAALSGDAAFVYCYERALDHAGHGHGWRSAEWRRALAAADAFAARLRHALPDDVRLLITADHGMVDVPPDDRVVAEDHPELLARVTLLGGEARFRHLYTPQPDAVAAAWRDRLGERAWVATRAEAEAAGWFGDLAPGLASRFGDVCVAARGTTALLSRTFPKEMGLVGMHGSLTPAEMRVPLLVD